MCPDHGCQTLPVPWAGPGSRYTLLFESFVISWLKSSTTDAVRKQLRLSWNAVEKIAFDHFYVAKMLCAVVDKTRQSEMKTIPLQARKSAHRSRYLWLYGRHKRHGRIAERLEAAQRVLPDTSRCRAMKELARELWSRRYDEQSRHL